MTGPRHLAEYEKFLAKDGMALFILNVIFSKRQEKETRQLLAYILIEMLKYSPITRDIVGAYMPVEFFTIVLSQ